MGDEINVIEMHDITKIGEFVANDHTIFDVRRERSTPSSVKMVQCVIMNMLSGLLQPTSGTKVKGT